MVDFLLRLSLRHRVIVLAVAAVTTAFGVFELQAMPVDVLPDVSAPRVVIVTEATGLAPVEFEQLITFPIETAVNGAAGTRSVRSASAPGISIVFVDFDWDTDEIVARQRVTERLQSIAGALPEESTPPLLAPSSSVMGEIAFVALTSDTASELELRRIAERDVRRRLLAVDGISRVVVIGGAERQYQVILDPAALARFSMTPGEVADAVRRGSTNAPGGYVVEGPQESIVRVLGRARGADDLERIRVAERDGVPVTVADVAEVRLGAAVRRGDASYEGRPAIILSVVKQPAADTVSTTARVDEALDGLEPSLRHRGVTVHRDLFRQVDFIETSIDNVVTVLRDGAILVALVLVFFLWHPGATVISVLAIPLSVLGATLALDALGYGLNVMTIGGLAIAVGELVDDAIVDVENVARRLRERGALPEAERPPLLETVYRASSEIRTSIVSATFVLALVFLPILFLGGFEGRLLAPLAVAYLVAIGASLVVAITITPVLASYLLPLKRHDEREPPLVRGLLRAFTPALDASMRRPGLLLVGAALFAAAGVVGLTMAGRSFLPELREGALNVGMVTLPGTSLAESDQLGRLAEEALMADPAVTSVARRVGRAERDEHVQGPERNELEVQLDPDDPRSREALLEDLRHRVSVVPGATFTFGQPISHRIDHLVAGHRTALAVKLVDDDLGALRAAGRRVESALRALPGLVDVEMEPMVDVPQLTVDVDADAAARYGLSRGEAARVVGLALWGQTAEPIFEEGVATEVMVRFSDRLREDPAALRSTLVPTPSGATVPIEAIADVRVEPAPNYVMREGVRRRLFVTANTDGADVGAAAESVRAALGALDLGDVSWELTGRAEEQARAQARLLLLGLVALLGIVLVVGATLRSGRRTAIVLTNLPLALTGGVVGVWLSGGTLSVATTIGFITLFGIATRNGILLATRMHDLEGEGVERYEAARRAALERLAPITMTALTAALGLLPLGLALGEPGTEIQAPMALVILTGLASSTVLNMVVVPSLLARWGGDAAPLTGSR